MQHATCTGNTGGAKLPSGTHCTAACEGSIGPLEATGANTNHAVWDHLAVDEGFDLAGRPSAGDALVLAPKDPMASEAADQPAVQPGVLWGALGYSGVLWGTLG